MLALILLTAGTLLIRRPQLASPLSKRGLRGVLA
ncbi:MAG: hypothetical protein IIB57_16455 [Planctomycetes bacterium]|nr:hypothetical protein [Planctomycetota bacterium]